MSQLSRNTPIAVAIVTVLFGSLVWAKSQPYAGQDGRSIASLSAQDVDDLVNGRGWGFAKSAELNGFPGPAHILELADELALTDTQRTAVQEVFDRMNAEARQIGAAFVEAEAALDQAFEDGTITRETLTTLTDQAGDLRADLRALHLAAHLEVKPLLSRHQIMTYNDARGYADVAGHTGHDHN